MGRNKVAETAHTWVCGGAVNANTQISCRTGC